MEENTVTTTITTKIVPASNRASRNYQDRHGIRRKWITSELAFLLESGTFGDNILESCKNLVKSLEELGIV